MLIPRKVKHRKQHHQAAWRCQRRDVGELR
jgi:hypothetical protein